MAWGWAWVPAGPDSVCFNIGKERVEDAFQKGWKEIQVCWERQRRGLAKKRTG